MSEDQKKSKDDVTIQFRKSGPQELAQLKARLRDTYSDELSWSSQFGEKDKKPKKVHCITRAMAEDFSREQVLFSSLIETLFYIFFASACCIHVTHLKSSDMFYMNEAVKQGLLVKEFGGDNDEDIEPISFAAISTVSDMWRFISKVFIYTIYFDKYYNKYSSIEDDKVLSVLYENVLLGVPRIRQVRVTEDSCEVHTYFRRLFRLCYGPYNEANEDKSAFGLAKGTAWEYTPASITKNIKTVGKVATYNGGGYYLDLSLNGKEAKAQIQKLEENLWITRNSRAVFLDFTVYNTNLNIFGNCKIMFELPPTGGVLPSYKFDSVKLVNNFNEWGYLAFICETIFYIYIFIYLLQSIRELIYFKWKYFLRFWSYIDCSISALAISTFIMTNYMRTHIENHITNIQENPDKYGNLQYMAHLQGLHDDTSAVTLFFVFMRFFKYLNFNRTMGQLNDTLKKCAVDIMGFSIMFFIIFFAYSELGFLLFGAQVSDFRTFGHSMFTLLRTILGDFDYEPIERAHRILAPIYFLSYIFLVFFVLLNMFLAIINDTYADVKTEIAIAPTELQMTDYLKQHFFKITNKCRYFRTRRKKEEAEEKKMDFNVTADEIRRALEKCGFSYLEIEMFFARYNINPLAVVTEYDISRLVAELESMTPGNAQERQSSPEAVKNMEELIEQKQQLKDMEATMFHLATKIDELIQKLEKLGAEREESRKESSDASSF
ncbi:hypothetical protein HHI36_019990 [Cryptolaemus montrouzieri]|uniref:Polycystic kidney disease 2-like 1 protein n=1 Tax=Cryptolaemus montrouzieri TaxID=559131 RepID=A0ABD2N948_9CUCU